MVYPGQYRGPDADEAWRMISTVFTDVQDVDPEDRGAYWIDVQVGTALLLAALHLLVRELRNHSGMENRDDTPLLVKQIMEMVESRHDSIREVVLKHLFKL